MKKIVGNFEHVHCPTCGPNAKREITFKRQDGISFYNCLECNIEYASPRLVEESLFDLYEGDDWRDKSFYKDWTYESWKKSKGHDYYLIQENIKLINKFLKPGTSILDVGCDIGLTVKALEDAGYHSEGVETSSTGAQIAKEKTGIKVSNTLLSDFKSDKKFDGVLLLDVLEHLYDPVKVLKECAANQHKGGHIFVHVPHHKGLGTQYKKYLHKRGIKQDYGHFGFPAHIYGFDKKSLRKILKKSGYETIHFESWSNILTRGKVNIFNYIIVQLIKKFSLSDYIVCVARKL